MSIILSVVPPALLTVAMGFSFAELLSLLALAFISVCSGMLIGTGITANNPSYDDTKSKAFVTNMYTSVMIYLVTFIATIFVARRFALGSLTTVAPLLGVPVLLVGLIIVYIGAKRLGRQL